MNNKKEFVGYLGGQYDWMSLHENYEDAERGQLGGERLYDLLEEFDAKKVKITIEVLEDDIQQEEIEYQEYRFEFHIPSWKHQRIDARYASWSAECFLVLRKDIRFSELVRAGYKEIGSYPKSAECKIYKMINGIKVLVDPDEMM